MLRLFLAPYKEGIDSINREVLYHSNNIDESNMILYYIKKIDEGSLKIAIKEVKNMERELGNRLYSASFKVANYSLWKQYMDLFCCLVCIELSINKNYGLKCSKGVIEYQSIASNYVEQLNTYSEVYQWMKAIFPEYIRGVEKPQSTN